MKLVAKPWIGMLLFCVAWSAQGQTQTPDATPAFKKLDSAEARVQGCVTCHGQQGQGTANGYFPRIAGKPAGYLYNQLIAFRNGTRHYPPMNYLVAYLPDAYLKEMAEHFAAQRPAYSAQERPVLSPAAAARGKMLVTSGDPKKGLPACVARHSWLSRPKAGLCRRPAHQVESWRTSRG